MMGLTERALQELMRILHTGVIPSDESAAVDLYYAVREALENRSILRERTAERDQLRAEVERLRDELKKAKALDAADCKACGGWAENTNGNKCDACGGSGEQVALDAVAVIAQCKDALRSWRDAMIMHGEWDDGCFYYARTSASELQSRIDANDTALAAIAAWEAGRGD